MWTLACSITDKYSDLKDLFYQRARKYVEADYIKGYGEHMISVAHCQAHILLSCYEMRMMYFPRAWINTGSAIRLAQMYENPTKKKPIIAKICIILDMAN